MRYHLLVCADDNLWGDNISTIRSNTEALFDGSEKFGLEVSTEKTNII